MNESSLLKNDLAILRALTATMACVLKVANKDATAEQISDAVNNAYALIGEASTQVESSVDEYKK